MRDIVFESDNTGKELERQIEIMREYVEMEFNDHTHYSNCSACSREKLIGAECAIPIGKRYRLCPCGHRTNVHIGHHCPVCRTGRLNCLPAILASGRPDNCHFCRALKDAVYHKALCACPGCLDSSWLDYPSRKRLMVQARHKSKLIEGTEGIPLDRELIFISAVADFYLLLEASMEANVSPEIMERFKLHTAYMSEQLATYLECASLGEFRHILEYNSASVCYNIGVLLTEDMKMLSQKMFELFVDTFTNCGVVHGKRISRRLIWKLWPEVNNKLGLKAHELMAFVFRSSGGGSIGGPLWGRCIDLVRAFRAGELSSVLFTDLAFGLKHNNSIAFDKFWDVEHVDIPLDIVRDGQYLYRLWHFASPELRKVFGIGLENRHE